MMAVPHAMPRSLLILVAVVLAVTGCDVAKTKTALSTPPGGGVSVTVTPSTASVVTGGTQAFQATVTGTSDTAVTWEIQEAPAGGSIGSGGLYTAPATAGTYHVVARSHFDTGVIGTATVTVSTTPPPISVSITPTAPTADACATVTFRATVSGSTNQGVNWSVQEGAAGGTITTGGVYTAPGTAGTYHVRAAAKADTSKTSTVPVVVGDERVLSVSVNPSTNSVTPSGTAQFTATITTTCGTSSATMSVPLPGSGSAN
jgi:hypothetical protein